MTTLNINPEFHSLIPPISPEEYQLLEENILQDGCREEIVIWNDCILDGHNRYEICQKHDLRFKVLDKTFSLETEDEAKTWIIRNQLARRNLPAHERTRLALLLRPAIEEKAKEKQKEGGGPVPQKSVEPPIDTQKEIAKLAGVSHDTVHKVGVIETEGSPEIKEAARKGKISVNRAYKATRKPKSKPRKRQKALPNIEDCMSPEFNQAFQAFFEAIRKQRKSKWKEVSKDTVKGAIRILEGLLI